MTAADHYTVPSDQDLPQLPLPPLLLVDPLVLPAISVI